MVMKRLKHKRQTAFATSISCEENPVPTDKIDYEKGKEGKQSSELWREAVQGGLRNSQHYAFNRL